MKKIKAACQVLLIAAVAIFLWETAWTFMTPTRFHARYLRQCEEVYATYAEVLNAVRPRLQDASAPTQER